VGYFLVNRYPIVRQAMSIKLSAASNG